MVSTTHDIVIDKENKENLIYNVGIHGFNNAHSFSNKILSNNKKNYHPINPISEIKKNNPKKIIPNHEINISELYNKHESYTAKEMKQKHMNQIKQNQIPLSDSNMTSIKSDNFKIDLSNTDIYTNNTYSNNDNDDNNSEISETDTTNGILPNIVAWILSKKVTFYTGKIIVKRTYKYNSIIKKYKKTKNIQSLHNSNIWTMKIKTGYTNYKAQRNNELSYFYILEILESEVQNAKDILDMNYKSLESLKQLKNKFIGILSKAQYLQSNNSLNTPSSSYDDHQLSDTLKNSENYLENTNPQEYINVLRNKIKEMDDEMNYIQALNKQQKNRLILLNKHVYYYLLKIDDTIGI